MKSYLQTLLDTYLSFQAALPEICSDPDSTAAGQIKCKIDAKVSLLKKLVYKEKYLTFEGAAGTFLEFSRATFLNATALSSLRKLKKELEELHDSWDLDEYVDCFLCLIDSADRQGYTMEQIIEGMVHKTGINRQRRWFENPDHSYSHLKDNTTIPDRPPIGLRPEWIVQEHRVKEIKQAISHYHVQNFPIPDEWTRELEELEFKLEFRNSKP